MRERIYNNKVLALLPACAFMFSFLGADTTQDQTQQNLIEQDQEQTQTMQPVQAPNPQMPTANPQPNGQLANVDDENPNDPTKAPDIADASDDAKQQQCPANAKPAPISTTITAIGESGATITCQNGMQFDIPSFLRKKTINWAEGDNLTLAKGKRDNWYKIINVTRKEKVRARVTTSTPK